MPARACRRCRRFLADARGSAAIFIAVALPALLALAGLGIDSSNLYMAHSRLQGAVDAAALAASLQLPYDPDMSRGLVEQAAQEYLTENHPGAQLVSVAPGTAVRSVQITARAKVDMMLLPVIGIGSETIEAKAMAGFNNLEIVFVIDNSGSMAGAPINETNEAAAQLVDLVMPDGLAASVQIGLVPFRGKVRIPANVDGKPAGCRNADGSYNDGLNSEYYDRKYRYPYYSRLQVTSGTCDSIPFTHALTRDKQEILSAIYEQDGRGDWSGTVISEGLKWGTNVLTPEAPFTEGDASGDMRKILILLTDGDTEDGMCGGSHAVSYTPNNYWTNAYYGMLDMDAHCENQGRLNEDMLKEAVKAKAAGIEIFCIRYGVSDYEDVRLLKEVASSTPGTDDHYFDAPSPYDIGDIFKKIGRQLGWRLLQ
nr:vWA domain-containing protein [Desulfobaculum xiamenense]